MLKKELLKLLNHHGTLVTDGATGSNLQARGLALGEAPERWVLENPDQIEALHRDFITAGSDILLTCTFGGTRTRLKAHDLQDETVAINQRAVAIARKAAEGTQVFVCGSMGPLGVLLQPYGPLEPAEAAASYGEQAKLLSDSGVDLLLIETQYDLAEAMIAVEAAMANSNLPLICSFSYDRGTRTMMGVKPAKMAAALVGYDLVALGINCGKSLDDNLLALKELNAATDLPIWFKPNAGLPDVSAEGKLSYATEMEAMAGQVAHWVEAGTRFIGGCCGTSPEHLGAIARAIHQRAKS